MSGGSCVKSNRSQKRRQKRLSHRSVWLERLACFDQRLEAGENAWPAIGTGGVGSVVVRPLVMRDGDPGRLTLRHKLNRDARDFIGRAKGERILQQLWRPRLEHLAANVDGALTIGPRADPVHRTAGLQIGFEFGPREDDAVGFGGDEALPDFIWRCDEVEDEVQWNLLGHMI